MLNEIPFGMRVLIAILIGGITYVTATRVRRAFGEAKGQLFTLPSLIATVIHDLVIGALVAIVVGIRLVVLGIV